MAQARSLICFLAVVGTVGVGTMSEAFAQTTPPPANGHPQPATPPATGTTPSPSDAATTPASTSPQTTPAPGAAGPSGTVTPPPDEGDDLSMTFHSSRTTDMQQFAEGSMQEISIGRAKPRYALNLFGDMSFGTANRTEGNLKGNPAFAVGVFDMLFNGDLDGKILATAEMTFQYEPNAPIAELERLHVRWKPAKSFFLEVGRFHTDIGYWNVAYHHGKWLQLSIERPRVIQLHGGLVPVHWIGAQTGLIAPVGKGTISLIGSIGSSRDAVGSGSHNAHGTAYAPINGGHLKLEAAGLGLSDLKVGVSGVYSRIAPEISAIRPGLPDNGMDEYIGNAYIAFPSVPFTFIAEGYVIQHQIPTGDLSTGLAGAKWRNYAAFAMIGYTIGRVTPYIKGEYIKTKQNVTQPDPFYIPAPTDPNPPRVALDLLEGTVGARIDTSTWSALKLEYRVTSGRGTRREFDQLGNKLDTPLIHTATVNWSFGI